MNDILINIGRAIKIAVQKRDFNLATSGQKNGVKCLVLLSKIGKFKNYAIPTRTLKNNAGHLARPIRVRFVVQCFQEDYIVIKTWHGD